MVLQQVYIIYKERILAMQNPLTSHDKPHQKFADAPTNPAGANPPSKMPVPPNAQNQAYTNVPYLSPSQMAENKNRTFWFY